MWTRTAASGWTRTTFRNLYEDLTTADDLEYVEFTDYDDFDDYGYFTFGGL